MQMDSRTSFVKWQSSGGGLLQAIESMNGARFVHDQLEFTGWEVEIAEVQRIKGLAPFACKTDKIDAWVLAELLPTRPRSGDLVADFRSSRLYDLFREAKEPGGFNLNSRRALYARSSILTDGAIVTRNGHIFKDLEQHCIP